MLALKSQHKAVLKSPSLRNQLLAQKVISRFVWRLIGSYLSRAELLSCMTAGVLYSMHVLALVCLQPCVKTEHEADATSLDRCTAEIAHSVDSCRFKGFTAKVRWLARTQTTRCFPLTLHLCPVTSMWNRPQPSWLCSRHRISIRRRCPEMTTSWCIIVECGGRLMTVAVALCPRT